MDERPETSRGFRSLLFAAAFAWFAFAGWRHATAIPAVGDEPDYLLIAQSLWMDGDIDTDNNYARGDYEAYAPGLGHPPGLVRQANGRAAPVHSVGLPLLLAPAFALGGRMACVILMAALAAALAMQCHFLALRTTGDRAAALTAWLSTLCLPTLGLATSLYPEVPAALAIALALRWITAGASTTAALGAALALSALPWLHARVAGAALVLGLFATVRLRGRARAVFFVTAAFMAAAYFTFFRIAYGVATPLQIYRGAMNRPTPELALTGLLFDPSYGLLPYAPILVLSLAGLVYLLRQRNGDRWAHLGLALALVTPVILFRKWWGGFCPPARFLVPVVPLLAMALAARLAQRPESTGSIAYGLARFRHALLALTFVVAVIPVVSPQERLLLNTRDESPRLWSALVGPRTFDRFLPKVSSRAGSVAPPWRPPQSETRVALSASVAVAFLLILDQLTQRRRRWDKWFPVGALVIALAHVSVVSRVIRAHDAAQIAPHELPPEDRDDDPTQ